MKHASRLFGLIVALGLLMSNCKPDQGPTPVFAEAESLMYTHPDSALHLLQAIPTPEQLTGQAQADYALLMTQAKSRNRIYATSDSLIRIAVDYYQHSDEMGQKAKTLLYLGDVLMDMERYADATLPLKQAEELMEHVSDRQIQTMIYSNLGYLNRKAGDYELALSYYKKALAINRAYQDTDRIVSNLINIMNLPIPEFADSAENYICQLEQEISSARPDLQEKAYNNIGVYYKRHNQLKKAEQLFQKAVSISKEIPYHSFKNLADIYIAQEKHQQADSLYQLALNSPTWAIRVRIYEDLYKRKLELGQTEEAAHYMNAYIQAVDSFHTHRQANEIQAIQQKYDQEVILRQKDRIEIWLYRIVFSFLTLLGILTALAWYLKRRYKTKLQTLQEQINKITSSAESDKAEISKLNDLLAQSNVIKQALQLSTLEDIQALEFYLRILQDSGSFHTKNDFESLKHWLDLSQNNFASRLKSIYPYLSPVELTICCLLRMGYSLKQISTMLKVQEETIRRNIYRACTHMNINGDKEKIKEFTSTIKFF
ncbi:MAG: tetratricopeptide repeat protein [Bacteroides sp.]|nr:tetratricopeptide repeat protein [Bacteroides sp.]